MSISRTVVARSFRQANLVFLLGSVALASPDAGAQTPAQPARSPDEPTPIASTRSNETISRGVAPSPSTVKAMPRTEGTASPGLKVTLDGSGSSGGRMWYRWLQTQGSRVAIDDPTRPEAHFTVPTDASNLGFVLVVGNASGVDARSLEIEVEDPERDVEDQTFRADAGDNQAVRVGRKVILNGIRSEPKGKIGFRWIQVAGPKASLKSSDGPTTTFVPDVPGTYQFALVVAKNAGGMSEPSTVKVTVDGTMKASAEAPSMAIDELARVSLASIDGSARYADDLAKVFDNVADGIGAFRTFSETLAETTRRLDAVVPRDRERRSVWIEQLFTPLMARFVSGMKADGLDLAQPGSQVKAMSRDQKTRLADQFRYTAAGLRAAKTMR